MVMLWRRLGTSLGKRTNRVSLFGLGRLGRGSTVDPAPTAQTAEKPLRQKGFMMDRYEREELAELILRVINTTREACTALYALPADMAAWSTTAAKEADARRECWEALYRLEVADRQPEKRSHVRVVPPQKDKRGH